MNLGGHNSTHNNDFHSVSSVGNGFAMGGSEYRYEYSLREEDV